MGRGGHLTSGCCARLLERTARDRPDVSMRSGHLQFVTTVVSSEVRCVCDVSELRYVQLWQLPASVNKTSELPLFKNSNHEEIQSFGPRAV